MRSSHNPKRLFSSFTQLHKNDNGVFSLFSVTVFFALTLLLLGLIELTRLHYMRLTLQQATDAAALAARALYKKPPNPGNSKDKNGNNENNGQSPSFNELSLEAERYFNLNYPSAYMPLITQGPTLEIAGSSLTVTATLSMQPLVLFVFNQPFFSINVQSTYPLP